jgi:orotate phosphoribosyltransferase
LKDEKHELKLEFSKILLKTGALKFGVFKLTSGKLSPYYIDLRVIPSFPKALRSIINLYKLILEEKIEKQIDKIVGIPTSGIPFAAILAYILDKPFIYVRGIQKTHGREKRIEGILHPGENILIVDDLITSGKSIISTVEVLRSEGGKVKDALVLIDRDEGGIEKLKKIDVTVHTFVKIKDIAKILREMESITEVQYKEITQS